MNEDELLAMLTLLRARSRAQQENGGPVVSAQLDAHFDLAYACGVPPTAWEVMVSPGFFIYGRTDFLGRHYDEIAEALTPKLTFELLQSFAVRDGNSISVYDIDYRAWRMIDVPSFRWFPNNSNVRKTRSVLTKVLNLTREESLSRAKKDFDYWLGRCASDPSDKNQRMLRDAEVQLKRWQRDGPEFLEAEARRRESLQDSLDRLNNRDTTKLNFAETLGALVRQTENEVRARYGIAPVGHGWVGEMELYSRIRDLLPGVQVVHHGQPHWLGRQHLDIWIPSMSVAVEYHGEQHFQAVDFFGGEEAFQRNQERDERKRSLCKQNGLRLIEISYRQAYIEDAELVEVLHGRAQSDAQG